MGRIRREYPTGKLRLIHPSKYDENKAYTLYYEYTWLDGYPIRRDTGLRVKVEQWNPKGTTCKGGELNPSFGGNYKQRNTMLADTLRKYDALLHEYSIKHPHQMTSEIIHAILFDAPLTREDEGIDFVEYVKECLKSKYTRGKIGKSRYENGLCNMNGFSEFLRVDKMGTYNEKQSLYLGDISPKILDAYILYRKTVKHNGEATINHALTPIINACEEAADSGLLSRSLFAQIKKCRVVVVPNLNEDSFDGKSTLTKEQLQKIVDFYNNDNEPRRKDYIEMFLFAFHAGGLRPVDVMTLTWNNVHLEKREIRKVLIKTAKGRKPRHTIPLNDAAIAILKKWKEMNRRNKFVFDLLPDDFNINDEDALYNVRNGKVRNINQALAIVGERIGLPFTLTFKVARHSFATLALTDGMSMSVVSRMLGHSSTDTTESYYAEYLPQKLDEELNKLHFCFIPDSIKPENNE